MYADGSLLLSGFFLFKLPSKSYSLKNQVARKTGNGIALRLCKEWTVLVEREFNFYGGNIGSKGAKINLSGFSWGVCHMEIM